MKNLKIKLLFALCAILLFSAFITEKKDVITIFMIGDSTMANKSLKDGNLERGWGQMLPCFLTEDVAVDNHAMNGRSSLSFINEGRWDAVLAKLKKGDYVFILHLSAGYGSISVCGCSVRKQGREVRRRYLAQ